MKVLLAHKFFHITGGAEVFFFEVGRLLTQHGHDVAYFSTLSDQNKPSRFSQYFTEAPSYNDGSLLKKSLGIGNMIYSKDTKEKFTRVLEEFQPDIVHVFAINIHLSYSILEAAKNAGIPVVMSCNDYKHICPNYKLFDGAALCEACKGGQYYHATVKKCCKDSLVFSFASMLEAYAYKYNKVYDRLVDRYLFASEFMMNKTKEFWHDKQVQYGILKNPFDASEYQPVYHGDYVLYFGRIIDEKGVDRIVEAAQMIDVPIKIVGDGPDLYKLKAVVELEKLSHIEFMGAKWGDELHQLLYGARFVLVPSVWHENFPYVIFQAFAAGKPVLGSLRGGIPQLIGEDRGVLFDPECIQDLAEKMLALWKDVKKCECMGKKAREYVVRCFSDDVIYGELMENYKAVLR